MNNLEQKIPALIENLIVKSWKDKEFKERFIKKPKDEIYKITNNEIRIKDNITVKVEDQSNRNFIYLNIPRKIDFDEIELSDEELEKVSGGTVSGGFCETVAIGLAVYAIKDFVDGAWDTFKSRLK